MSRTLSGLFLVGAVNRPRKRKTTNRENPRTIPAQIGKIAEKSGKSEKGQKRTKKDKKEGQVQIGKPPRLKPPRLAALEDPMSSDQCFMLQSLSGPVRDTPHIAQYPFEIVSQRGVSHPFALFSHGIAQVSLRYPFSGGGGIAPPLRIFSKGETLRRKVPKRTKKDKKGRTSLDRETPPFETPPFSGPWQSASEIATKIACLEDRNLLK